MKHVKKYLGFILRAVIFVATALIFIVSQASIITMLIALCRGDFSVSGISFVISIVSLFLLVMVLDIAELINQKGWFN